MMAYFIRSLIYSFKFLLCNHHVPCWLELRHANLNKLSKNGFFAFKNKFYFYAPETMRGKDLEKIKVVTEFSMKF